MDQFIFYLGWFLAGYTIGVRFTDNHWKLLLKEHQQSVDEFISSTKPLYESLKKENNTKDRKI